MFGDQGELVKPGTLLTPSLNCTVSEATFPLDTLEISPSCFNNVFNPLNQ